MSSSFVAMYAHIVFSTKDRKPQINLELIRPLFEEMNKAAVKKNGQLLAGGGQDSHVHLLVSLGGEWSTDKLVNDIKAASTKWAKKNYPDKVPMEWQTGYAAFAVPAANLEVVLGYINDQPNVHATMSYEDEFRALLTKHRVTFDEATMWL
jgi:putative transposase